MRFLRETERISAVDWRQKQMQYTKVVVLTRMMDLESCFHLNESALARCCFADVEVAEDEEEELLEELGLVTCLSEPDITVSSLNPR